MFLNACAVFIAQYLYIFVLLVAAIFFFTRPKAVMKSMAICGVIIAPLAYVISRISSLLYYDPRPFVIGHFTPLIAHAADNGFPSDHVLLTGAVAMIVWFYNKKLSVMLWVLALLIGWARVYAGVHHWTDIMGSIVMVLVSGLVYWFFARRKSVGMIK
jgi:undecaprenyl-diphosphatase